MNGVLSYKLGVNETLLFYGHELNDRHDFMIRSNCRLKEVEYLLFFDSRGISKSYEESLIKLIIDSIGNKARYLIIARPIEITIWLTLFNFLRMNEIRPQKIITNMGFVDFTPKKRSVIDQTIFQYTPFLIPEDAQVHNKEMFRLSNGDESELFTHSYPQSALDIFIPALHKQNLIIINTPELTPDFQYPRPRPTSFSKAVQESNLFNCMNFNKFPIISLKNFSIEDSYDGVHYTTVGNEMIFEKLLPSL